MVSSFFRPHAPNLSSVSKFPAPAQAQAFKASTSTSISHAMKPSLVALFTTILITTAAVRGEDCDIEMLKPLFFDTSVVECTDASGFSLVPSVKPTPEVLAKVCASDACQRMLNTLEGFHMGDCTLLNIQLETDLLTPAKDACAASTARDKNSTKNSGPGDTGSVESPVATKEDSTDVAPGTVRPNSDLPSTNTNTVETQAPASSAIADPATKTAASTVSSATSSRATTAAIAAAAVVVATTLLQLLV